MYHPTVQNGNVELACPKTWNHCQVEGGSCRLTSSLQRVSLDRAVNRNQETTMKSDTFETTLTQLVFEPLGMMSSSLAWRPQLEANFASPHENGKPIAKQRLAAANASGSLQTTAIDFGRFLIAALTGERLSDNTFRQWLEPVFHVPWATTEHLNLDPIKRDDEVAWGLGWGIEINRKSFFQWGWLDGTRAFVMGDPTEQSGAVLLTNSNTGLRLAPEVFEAVMPGAHPAIEWCKWNR
jgi:CubicO group peptidase (beta-lactamase class C family)